MQWIADTISENALVVLLICAVWYQLNGAISRVRERVVRVETQLGVDDSD